MNFIVTLLIRKVTFLITDFNMRSPLSNTAQTTESSLLLDTIDQHSREGVRSPLAHLLLNNIYAFFG